MPTISYSFRSYKISLILLVSLYSIHASAQTIYNQSLDYIVGNYLVRYDGMPSNLHLQQGVIYSISKQTTGKKYYQYAHNYPNLGLSIAYRSLGNTAVYGHAISIIPYVSFSVLQNKNSSLFIKHGVGVAYLTKKFDINNNPKNEFIGSHFNAGADFMIGFQQKISKKLDFKIGAVIHHYSNGSVKNPNKGMNILSGLVGITYVANRKFERIKYPNEKVKRRFRYRIGGGLGFYRNVGLNQPVRNTFQTHAMVFYQYNTRFRTGLGLEYFYLNKAKQPLSLYLENEVQFANITTRYGFGYYFGKRPAPTKEAFYSKIGACAFLNLKNKIPDGFYIGAYLKAHGFSAAHIEITVGYLL